MNVNPTMYSLNHIQKFSKKYTNLTKSDDLDTRKSKFKSESLIKRKSKSMEDILFRNPKIIDPTYFHRISSSESITSSISSLSDELIFPLNHQQLSPRKIEFNFKFWKINHRIYTIDETPEILSTRLIDSEILPIERNEQIKSPLNRRTINKPRKIKIDTEKLKIESKTTYSSSINCTAKQNKTSLSCISFKHMKALICCKNLKTKNYVKIQ